MIFFKPVTVNINFTVELDDQKSTTFDYSFKMRPHNNTEYKKIYGDGAKKFKKLKLDLVIENRQQIDEFFVWILRAGAEGLHPITIFNCEIVRDDGVKQIFNAYIESHAFFDEILSNPLAEPMVEFIITKNPT